MSTYDLNTLLQIRDEMGEPKKIILKDEALTRILGLLESNFTQFEDQKYIRTSAVVENQNSYIPTHLKVDRNVTDINSPKVKLQNARLHFNKLNKKNADFVASEIKKLVKNHEIASIFFDAIFAPADDRPEKFDVWKYWIQLLPKLNQNTNNSFKKDIVNDTLEKFNSLNEKKTDVESYKKIGCWFSCLLFVDFISQDEYSRLLHDVIKLDHLNITDAISVVYSSLSISGKKIDDKRCPLTKCWFLFTFLKMNLSNCPNHIKFNVIDLFDLRKFDWDEDRFLAFLDGSKPKVQAYKPATWKDFTNNYEKEYSQKEFWEGQFTDYCYHPDNYKIPEKYQGNDQSVTKNLLSLLIKQKGQKIEDFLSFGSLVLAKVFKNDQQFIDTMIKIKPEFRKQFEGEEITIFNENHNRFYKLISTFLLNKYDNLYNYVKKHFDVYLHINNLNTKDQIISPAPSAFIQTIFLVSGTEDYLTPEQCKSILSQFPADINEFNNFVYKQQNSENTGKEKKLDDFWPFLIQLAFDTNPDVVDSYFEKNNNYPSFTYYERLLYLYTRSYSALSNEKNEDAKLEIGQALQAISFEFDQDQRNKCFRAALELLQKDGTIESEAESDKLFDAVTLDIVGSDK